MITTWIHLFQDRGRSIR